MVNNNYINNYLFLNFSVKMETSVFFDLHITQVQVMPVAPADS